MQGCLTTLHFYLEFVQMENKDSEEDFKHARIVLRYAGVITDKVVGLC